MIAIVNALSQSVNLLFYATPLTQQICDAVIAHCERILSTLHTHGGEVPCNPANSTTELAIRAMTSRRYLDQSQVDLQITSHQLRCKQEAD